MSWTHIIIHVLLASPTHTLPSFQHPPGNSDYFGNFLRRLAFALASTSLYGGEKGEGCSSWKNPPPPKKKNQYRDLWMFQLMEAGWGVSGVGWECNCEVGREWKLQLTSWNCKHKYDPWTLIGYILVIEICTFECSIAPYFFFYAALRHQYSSISAFDALFQNNRSGIYIPHATTQPSIGRSLHCKKQKQNISDLLFYSIFWRLLRSIVQFNID